MKTDNLLSVDALIDESLDTIDDVAQDLTREKAREFIHRLRDELNLRADDFDGYFGEAQP